MYLSARRGGELANQTKRVAPDQKGITGLSDQEGNICILEPMFNIYPKTRRVSSAYLTKGVAFFRPQSKDY